jgi:hypothetical protein
MLDRRVPDLAPLFPAKIEKGINESRRSCSVSNANRKRNELTLNQECFT